METERAGPTDTERYSGSFEVRRLSLGEGTELVYSPLTRTANVLPTATTRLLQGCRGFATLDEHAGRLCRELGLGPDQAPAVRGQLEALAGSGLLVAHAGLAERCRHRNAPDGPPPRIAVVGVPTRERPASLRRCLLSFIEHGRRHGRAPDFVVVDDSDEPAAREANQQVLRSLRADTGAAVLYAGPDERARFADVIVRHAGLPPEAVRFALLNDERYPVATGAGRNALLLHAAGDVLLQADDDTVCRPAATPNARDGLAFSSRYDPTEFWLPEEGEPLPAGDVDFLGAHERLLGQSPGACAAGAASGLTLDRADAGFFRKLEVPGARVLVTAAGVAGDSGMGSPAYLLSLDGDSRARLLRSEAVYRRALDSRQLVRAVTRETVCDGAVCMALNLGLDNRDLLPPFLPVQRNQDGVFGAVLRACFAGFFGFLPRLVRHDPPAPRRPGAEETWRAAARVHSGQIMQALVQALAPGRADGAKGLQALGQSLAEWGAAPRADFEEFVRLQLWGQRGRQALLLDAQLRQTGGRPEYWAEDARRLLAMLRAALPAEDYVVPYDLADAFGADAARPRMQRLAHQFGELLSLWPEVVGAARELRKRGRRPAVAV